MSALDLIISEDGRTVGHFPQPDDIGDTYAFWPPSLAGVAVQLAWDDVALDDVGYPEEAE